MGPVRRLLSLVVVGLAIAGCAPTDADGMGESGETGETDPQGWWRLKEGPAGATPADADGNVYLRLTGGRLETLTPCGVYSAQLKGKPGGEREISGSTGGPIDCQPETMNFDARYLVTMGQVTGVTQDGESLVLAGDGGELRYEPVASANPLGSAGKGTWRLRAISFNGQLRAALDSPAATLTWERESRVAGGTGCRTFNLGYVVREADADEAADLGPGGAAISFDSDIEPTPRCEAPAPRLQDNWLRSILREDVIVRTDGELLTVTSDGTTAMYRLA